MWRHRNRGASSVEIALLLVLITIVTVGAFLFFGAAVSINNAP